MGIFMFRIILSLGEGIKGTDHMSIFCLLSIAEMPTESCMARFDASRRHDEKSECKRNMLFCRIMKEG